MSDYGKYSSRGERNCNSRVLQCGFENARPSLYGRPAPKQLPGQSMVIKVRGKCKDKIEGEGGAFQIGGHCWPSILHVQEEKADANVEVKTEVNVQAIHFEMEAMH